MVDTHPHAPVSLGALALTKDGSQMKVKEMRELAKMADGNTPLEGPDMRPHREFWAEHLNEGRLKNRVCHEAWCGGESLP